MTEDQFLEPLPKIQRQIEAEESREGYSRTKLAVESGALKLQVCGLCGGPDEEDEMRDL